MSTDKPCPFCSANSDQNTAVSLVCAIVDDDPIATAQRLFDVLYPTLKALSAVYDGAEKSAFWHVVIGCFASTVVNIVGRPSASSLMQLAGRLVERHAASQQTGRPN